MRCGLPIQPTGPDAIGIGTTPVFGSIVQNGKVCRFNTGFCQRVEQGGFPDVGQTDDTAFEPTI